MADGFASTRQDRLTLVEMLATTVPGGVTTGGSGINRKRFQFLNKWVGNI